MTLFDFLQSHFTLGLIIVAFISVCIGSFLCVLILRYPRILKNQWRRACQEHLDLPMDDELPLNLTTVRSHCPKCKTTIRFYHNIPILSYLLLRGHCAYCRTKIPIFYPTIEFMTMILSIAAIICFQWTWQGIAALLLTWILIPLFFIDSMHMLLPDEITIPGLWLGLLLNSLHLFTTVPQAVWGAALGYLILWSVNTLFRLVRKKEGMGYGDFKTLAMLGAWLGVYAMLHILLVAIFLGLLVSIIYLLIKKKQFGFGHSAPFGPALALSGWLTLCFGPFLLNYVNYG